MLIYLLGCVLLATSSMADSPLYIDELEDLVHGPDRRILDVLDNDKWTPRSELKIKLDEILARQSPATQKTYAHIVEMKEEQRTKKNIHWQSRSDAAGMGNLYEKIKLLQTDMTISEGHAKRRTREQWFEMGHGSSSEEHYYSRYSRSLRD